MRLPAIFAFLAFLVAPASAQEVCVPAFHVVETHKKLDLTGENKKEAERLLAAGAEELRYFVSYYDDCQSLLNGQGELNEPGLFTMFDSYRLHIIPVGLPVHPDEGEDAEDFEFHAVKMISEERRASITIDRRDSLVSAGK